MERSVFSLAFSSVDQLFSESICFAFHSLQNVSSTSEHMISNSAEIMHKSFLNPRDKKFRPTIFRSILLHIHFENPVKTKF